MQTPNFSGLINPYLFFEGRCEEAIEFYKKALGAGVQLLMRFRDCPVPPPAGLPPGNENKIAHARLRVGQNVLLVSDGRCSRKIAFRGFFLSISVSTEAEVDKIFGALADGGQVHMPLGKTFFSPRFGMVMDRFGLGWMILVHEPTTK